MSVRRIYVEKKPGFDIHAQKLFVEITDNLEIKGLERVRSIIRYDVEGITEVDYEKAKTTIFSEPPIDLIYEERMPARENERVLAVEYLPGQYDQRADSCSPCIQLLSGTERPDVRVANVIVLNGNITDEDYDGLKVIVLIRLKARGFSDKPHTLRENSRLHPIVETIRGFIAMDNNSLQEIAHKNGLQCPFEDLYLLQGLFSDTEKRDPTITELKMIDTTGLIIADTPFLTVLKVSNLNSGPVSDKIQVYQTYLAYKKRYTEKKKNNLHDGYCYRHERAETDRTPR